METPNLHLLRLIISCRKITAQVTVPRTHTIIAMADSSEQDFASDACSRLNRYPRPRSFWDSRIASRVGEKLGSRLKDIGVREVEIDVDEESARPEHHRRPAGLVFDSVERAGVRVDGVEKL